MTDDADQVHRWVCTGTVPVGICPRTWLRKDAKSFGSVTRPISFRHTASPDRMPSLHVSRTELRLYSCAINPEHCDTAFPSELHNLNGQKSYSILRFELSQISSECVFPKFDSAAQLTEPQNPLNGDEGAETTVFCRHRIRQQAVWSRH